MCPHVDGDGSATCTWIPKRISPNVTRCKLWRMSIKESTRNRNFVIACSRSASRGHVLSSPFLSDDVTSRDRRERQCAVESKTEEERFTHRISVWSDRVCYVVVKKTRIVSQTLTVAIVGHVLDKNCSRDRIQAYAVPFRA